MKEEKKGLRCVCMHSAWEGKMKPQLKNVFVLFLLSFPCFSTLLQPLCFILSFFLMFATSKMEGGTYHVNVRKLF